MADKVTLNNLANLQNETTAVNLINANNAAITTAMNNTLSRDGTTPNTMSANLDMNSHRLLNLPAPISPTDPLRLADLTSSVVLSTTGTTIILSGSISGQTTIAPQSIASGTLMVPATTDTLVARNTAETLTNKTIDFASNTLKFSGTTISSSIGGGTSFLVTNAITGTGAVVLATNPSISGLTFTGSTNFGNVAASSFNSLTITAPASTSTTLTIANTKVVTHNVTQTFAGTDNATLTFQGTDTYVGRATTDTLTNKTFDSGATGNSFAIAGNVITSVSGTGSSVLLSLNPTIGTSILLNGSTSGTVTLKSFTGTFSWLLPTTAGTSGQILVSQAGTSSMTWAGGNSSLGIGFTAFSTSLGTISSSFTLDPTKANFQTYTNGGAHSLLPTASISTMVVDITNNASAGTVTITNFTKSDGDTLDTVNAHSFRCYISVGSNGSSHINIKRMV